MVSLTTHARETGGSCRPGRPARWAPSPTRPNAALRAADVTRGAHSARRAGRSVASPARTPVSAESARSGGARAEGEGHAHVVADGEEERVVVDAVIPAVEHELAGGDERQLRHLNVHRHR